MNSVDATSDLFVSEPAPVHFGNGANTPQKPGWTNKNWLKSRFHFSFAEYSSRTNTNFGVLRVCNDDLVQPERGFGMHGHANMEIITFIVAGQLTHKDSMGTAETLGRGDVQFMTAGSGVRHSEHNLNEAEPLRFIQMWIVPRARGLKPNYGSALGDITGRQDCFSHLVGDVEAAGDDAASGRDGPAVRINQDANIYVAEFSALGNGTQFNVAAGRQAYVLCLEGGISIAGEEVTAALGRHDAAEVFGPSDLVVEATGVQLSDETPGEGSAGMVLIVEMEAEGRSRFT